MKFLKILKKSEKTSSRLTEKQLSGNAGEAAALEYLQKLGYSLLEKNWRQGHSEIDLIMNDGGCVVFCEVRTHNEEKLHYTSQSESISYNKKVSLSKGAACYLSTIISPTQPCRFDVVEVTLEKGKVKEINHIKDAFYRTRSKTKGTRYKSCRH